MDVTTFLHWRLGTPNQSRQPTHQQSRDRSREHWTGAFLSKYVRKKAPNPDHWCNFDNEI